MMTLIQMRRRLIIAALFTVIFSSLASSAGAVDFPPKFNPKTGMLGADFKDAIRNAESAYRYHMPSEENKNILVKSLIVTFPDPFDTRYMREFDLMLDALIQAAAYNGYNFRSHYFPWKYGSNPKKAERKNRREPGLLLPEFV